MRGIARRLPFSFTDRLSARDGGLAHNSDNRIQVIDLFAGPGGLGEGFAAVPREDSSPAFRVSLSVEKEPSAHQSLELRSLFREFTTGRGVPEDYYEHLRGDLTREELFSKYPHEAERAREAAWRATLGEEPSANVDGRIRRALRGADCWVLIGGPPCQAYSIMGRSRNRGIKDYRPEHDNRHFMYQEYLRIIAQHWPPVFVMENVPGLLSARVREEGIFERILQDLQAPSEATGPSPTKHSHKYRICSLAQQSMFGGVDHDPRDFIVKAECYGVPQTRHRVILIGIRDDLEGIEPGTLRVQAERITVSDVLDGLPRLRSGLSREPDSAETWRARIEAAFNARWVDRAWTTAGEATYTLLVETLEQVAVPRKGRGGEFVPCLPGISCDGEWFLDPRLKGVCNHATRTHMVKDLHRYLYAACYAKTHRVSPILGDFPRDLLPHHQNVESALGHGNFADRFRVQVACKPATTVTSHIAKDGHYYIHPDPKQCRSLTVREAARLQTFPDNYFFCGPRTAQYTQVGNAVPPLLAKQIAEIVLDILD